MKTKSIILSTLLLLSYLSSKAQTQYVQSQDEARELSLKTMTFITQDSVAKAIETILPYSNFALSEYSILAQKLPNFIDGIQQTEGKIEGFTKLKEELTGEYLMREVYLLLLPESCYRFVFNYYKGAKGWLLTLIRFDSVIESEF